MVRPDHALPRTRRCSATACTSSPIARFARSSARWTSSAHIPRQLIDRLFELGVMGIEIPEAHGGAGATLLSRGARGRGAVARRSVGRRARRRAEHAGHQRAAALGHRRISSAHACRGWPRAPSAPTRCPRPAPAATRSRCRRAPTDAGDGFVLDRAQALDHQRATKPTSSSSSPRVDPDGRLPRHHGVSRRARHRRDSRSARRKTSSASAPAAPASCCSRTAGCQATTSSAKSARATRSRSRRSTKGASASARRWSAWRRARSITRSRYTKERKQFGKAIADFQGVQFQLARAATEVEAARLLVYNAARLRDAGEPFLKEAAMCKLFASEVAERVASLAVNLFGGYGFVKDYPVEKLYPRREDRADLRRHVEPAAADHRQADSLMGRIGPTFRSAFTSVGIEGRPRAQEPHTCSAHALACASYESPSSRAALPPRIAARCASVSPGVAITCSTDVVVHGNG